MRNVLIVFGAIVLLGAIGGATWSVYGGARLASSGMATSTALQVTTPPPIATPSATPNIITVGTSTPVIFTISIPEPTLNPASVNLLRVAPNGSSTGVAQMVDNGQNGDQKPGDKVFTARVVLTEPQAGEVKFQVSAAFRGILRRALSDIGVVRISSPITRIGPNGGTVNYPNGATFTIAPGGLSTDTEFLVSLPARQQLPQSLPGILPIQAAVTVTPTLQPSAPATATFRSILSIPLYSTAAPNASMTVLHYDVSTDNWSDVGTATTSGGKATFTTDEIGLFILVNPQDMGVENGF